MSEGGLFHLRHGRWSGTSQTRPIDQVEDDQQVPIPSVGSGRRQVQRRLNELDVAELVAAYRDGVAVNALALRFGVHRPTVMKHLDRAGLRRRWRKLTERDEDHAAEL